MFCKNSVDKATLNLIYTLTQSALKKHNDRIPLFKTWTQWYGFVILFLIVLVLLFNWFTNYFS